MSHHCPECQRILYSRRLKHCGYCGTAIPESLRFSPEEIEQRDRELEISHEQFRERQRAAAEEQAAKRKQQGDDGMDLWPLL